MKAQFDAAAAGYKGTVLDAFQEAEDNLARLHWLAQEAKDEDAAVAAAQKTLELSINLYRDGAVSSSRWLPRRRRRWTRGGPRSTSARNG